MLAKKSKIAHETKNITKRHLDNAGQGINLQLHVIVEWLQLAMELSHSKTQGCRSLTFTLRNE